MKIDLDSLPRQRPYDNRAGDERLRRRNNFRSNLNKRSVVPKLMKIQDGKCAHCGLTLHDYGKTSDIHHDREVADGGTHAIENLRLVHKACHYEIHAARRKEKAKKVGYMYVGRDGHVYIKGEKSERKLARVIVEKAIGRRLDRFELVKHLDGDPGNFHLENLLLCGEYCTVPASEIALC